MTKSNKFAVLAGIPANKDYVNEEQLEICALFSKMVVPHKPGWQYASIAYHVGEDGKIDLIDETKVYSVGEELFSIKIEKR